MPGLAFITFDFRKGPIVPYLVNLEKSIAEEIALKVFVGSLSMHSVAGDELFKTQESVIPFPDHEKVAFSHFFGLEDSSVEKGIRPSALTVVFESDEQAFLYKSAFPLTKQLHLVADLLSQNKYLLGSTLPNSVIDHLNQLCERSYLEQLESEKPVVAHLTTDPSTTSPSLRAIFSGFKKGVDQLVSSVISFEPVVVVTDDSALSEVILATLEVFCPHRNLLKASWVETFVPKADVQVGPPTLLESTPPSVCVANMTTGVVEGAQTSKYVSFLLKRLSSAPANELRFIAEQYINELITSLNVLVHLSIQLYDDPTAVKKEFEQVRKDLNSQVDGTGELVLRMMRQEFPESLERLVELLFVEDKRVKTVQKYLKKSKTSEPKDLDRFLEERGLAADYIDPKFHPTLNELVAAALGTDSKQIHSYEAEVGKLEEQSLEKFEKAIS